MLRPAGSGKSYTIQTVMTDAMEHDTRVIMTCPTLILLATYREKMPDLDVESIHSAFQIFKPEQRTLDVMTTYDLIVIEEVGQLSMDLFERLLRLWDAAERRPALVFVDDFAQLRGVEPTRATDSATRPEVKKFTLQTMRRCKCEVLKWKLELLRTAKPSREQLAKLLRGHKAPHRDHRTAPTMTDKTSEDGMWWIFREHPETRFVTITSSAFLLWWPSSVGFAPRRPRSQPCQLRRCCTSEVRLNGDAHLCRYGCSAHEERE